MNKCQKCNGTNFIKTFKFHGALIGTCENCNTPVLIESSVEYEEYCKQEAVRKNIKNQPPTIECPYCHSTDTKKISGTTRFVSTGLFGIASNKIGKNFHCNKCKADF